MGLSLDGNDQGPRRGGFSSLRLPPLPSVLAVPSLRTGLHLIVCKRLISSLTYKEYKTSEVEAVKVNAKKTQEGFCHPVGFVILCAEVQREGFSPAPPNRCPAG